MRFAKAGDASQDFVDGYGPNQRLRTVVAGFDIAANGGCYGPWDSCGGSRDSSGSFGLNSCQIRLLAHQRTSSGLGIEPPPL